MSGLNLDDQEIHEICGDLTQHAAMRRYLQGLGLVVKRKHNGFPLVSRQHYLDVMANAKPAKIERTRVEPNRASVLHFAKR